MVQRLAERSAGYHPLRTASSSTTASSSLTSSCPTSSAAATCTASPPPSTTTRYVGELAGMAKASNMVIVPDRPNDLSAVVATALGLHAELSGKAKATTPTIDTQPAGGRPPPKDWVTGG